MNRLPALLFFLALTLAATASHAAVATSSDPYAKGVRIEQESEVLKRRFEITAVAHSEDKSGDLKPRHTWAKAHRKLALR